MDILQKLRNYITWGQKTNIDDDLKPFPQGQIKIFDKVKDIVALFPYGHHANAPLDSLAVVITVGHEENQVYIPISGQDRPTGLKEGEVITGNFKVGSTIKFNSDGSIDIVSSGPVNVSAPSVNITGDVTVGGDLNVSGDIDGTNITGSGAVEGATVTDGVIDLGTHVHPAGTPPGNTGAPI